MWNVTSCYKKIVICFIAFLFLNFNFISYKKEAVVFAENSPDIESEISDNVEKILNETEAESLDEFVFNIENEDYFSGESFLDLVKKILNGDYFNNYNSLFDFVISSIKEAFCSKFYIIISIFAFIILNELFNSFCPDKYFDLKKIVRIVNLFLIITLISSILLSFSKSINSTVSTIFRFSEIIFPIILGLVLTAGATSTNSVFSPLFAFFINTGSYIFTYVLIPIVNAILVLSLFSKVVSKDRFSKLIDLFKSIFKYIVVIFFGIFGLFSTVNLISVGSSDGLNLKLTKYAIQNYIPVVGNYVSEGYDFVHICAVLVKNAFGVCGIFVLFFIIIKPVLMFVSIMIIFKIISAFSMLIGNREYADLFSSVSKALGYFVAVLLLLFLVVVIFICLLILSVGVL